VLAQENRVGDFPRKYRIDTNHTIQLWQCGTVQWRKKSQAKVKEDL
jgi:hypothetical protein